MFALVWVLLSILLRLPFLVAFALDVEAEGNYDEESADVGPEPVVDLVEVASGSELGHSDFIVVVASIGGNATD